MNSNATDQRLLEEIRELKREREAVVLAHNYQMGDIQDIADFVGDSLGLAYAARDTQAKLILFCGVHFMAETAKIVNPGRKVVIPDMEAGCSLADACPAAELEAFLAAHAKENYYVVAYINCSAGVKALADVICTSGNAVNIVRRVPADRQILFVPDQNLGEWVIQQTGRPMRLWEGCCYVHVEFTHASIARIHKEYPDAPVVAHPECPLPVRILADEVCSTERMIRYCREHSARTFIIVTESGMLHRLRKELPDRTFIPGPTDACSCSNCCFMKLNTLEKVRNALRDGGPEIIMDETLRVRALSPIERMLDWSR
jgi:quinolinate synthase